MNCQQTRQWMSPYLDSELGATKTYEVSTHLADCPACTNRFEAERGVDNLIRTRLRQEAMPPEMWARIQRDVATPAWIQRLRRPRNRALAACLALACLGGVALWTHRPETPSLARALLAAAPQDRPFTAADTVAGPAAAADANAADATKIAVGPDAVRRLLHSRFGVEFAMAALDASFGPHELELIDAVTRTDADGRDYVEVRLNCCGRPVLMAFARAGDGPLPAPFAGAFADATPSPAARDAGGAGSARRFEGVHVAARRFGDLVAVVASRHPVAQITAGLRLRKA